MAEGTFPKVGGDIVYASEINSFAGFSFISAGSTVTVGSATAVQELGSFVVPAGSQTNPHSLYIDFLFSKTVAGTLDIQISGVAVNSFIRAGADWADGYGRYYHFIGSPQSGLQHLEAWDTTQDGTTPVRQQTKVTGFSNIVGSPYAVIFRLTGQDAAGGRIGAYNS